MVLIGKHTRCSLCGEELGSTAYTAMRPFVLNRRDRLVPFSGRAFHERCFADHPLGALATHYYNAARRHLATPCRCVVCEEPVKGSFSGESLDTGLMTSDPDDPLYPFNFVCIHREHIDRWDRFPVFVRAIEASTRAGRWQRTPWLTRP